MPTKDREKLRAKWRRRAARIRTNPEKYMKKVAGIRRFQLETASIIREAKSQPCTDCQTTYPFYVMDLDHLPQFEKKFNLGGYISRSRISVLQELAKCEPVCANCHRERTWKRAQSTPSDSRVGVAGTQRG